MKLMTTEGMLKNLSVGIRLASYGAMDCSNHLAVHSEAVYAQALHETAQRLSELATLVRDIGSAHASPDTKEST